MADLPPPPPGYNTFTTPPATPAPLTEKKPIQSPSSIASQLTTKFPTQMSPQSQSPLPASLTPTPVPSSDGGSTTVSQFSTPPGPPVFSSPLRPAAIPFRTTPATPQTVPFSPPLTMSSPPLYSNGSTELPSKTSANVDETCLDLPNVLFSAHKVLKQKKLANTQCLGFGALISPGGEVTSATQVIQRDPHRCQNCGAYANLYCEILLASGQWQCVICKKLNSSDGEFVASRREDLFHLSELCFSTVDYIQTGNRRPGYLPVMDSRTSSPVFLVIDECLDEAHLQHLQGSLHAFVDSLAPKMRIGIITYGRTVSIYDFSEGLMAAADVLPGEKSPTLDYLHALIYGTGIYLAQVHASLPVIHTIFSSLRPYKYNFPEASRDRCLGAAVEVALALIQGPSAEASHGVVNRPGGNCRILVCAGGPNTYGPGLVPHSFSHPNYPYVEKTAIKWMDKLGQKARNLGTVVDVLCAGTCPVRVPVLQPLAKCSGGVLILQDDFGEAFGVNLQRASTRAAGSHGVFEIRCSNDILVTNVIGPGEEAPSESRDVFKNDDFTCIQMLSVEETQCFSLSMESNGDIKNDHVYFQFAIRYLNAFQAEYSRVITVRLPTVDSVSAYLQSVQQDVLAVLIAKRTLLHAQTFSDAVGMRSIIDERVRDIAAKFGTQSPNSKLYRFPKELLSLPEHLFHLRRGPLLGSIVGHEDERSVLRNLFLHASFDLSLRMLSPRCLMYREEGTFEELPAYDLAMQSDTAVLLDHGTDVFIWLGAELAAQEGKSAAALAACRTLAEELTEQRFPSPRILSFKEGSSQARYFVSRLIPAHKDPPYEQEARFPQLQSLNPVQRAKLKSSFIQFDDYSLIEWLRSMKISPPEPN